MPYKDHARMLERKREYYLENKDAILDRQREYRQDNPEKERERNQRGFLKNRMEKLFSMKRYRQENPGKFSAYANKYRAAQIQAIPPWLISEQLEEMIKFYEDCPEGYEVDHIIPLRSNVVCGLHVPWNLQYLPAKENRSKGNRLEVELYG